MDDELKKKAMGFIKKASSVVSEKLDSAKNEYDKSEIKKVVDEKAKQTKDYLNESGVSDKVSEISDVASEHLDKVSGKKILDVVEERLSIQDEYNNILATKLEEALQRIDILEKELETLKNME